MTLDDWIEQWGHRLPLDAIKELQRDVTFTEGFSLSISAEAMKRWRDENVVPIQTPYGTLELVMTPKLKHPDTPQASTEGSTIPDEILDEILDESIQEQASTPPASTGSEALDRVKAYTPPASTVIEDAVEWVKNRAVPMSMRGEELMTAYLTGASRRRVTDERLQAILEGIARAFREVPLDKVNPAAVQEWVAIARAVREEYEGRKG